MGCNSQSGIIKRYATSRLIRSVKKSSLPGWRMESLTALQSGGTSNNLTDALGAGSLTLFMADIRVNRSVSPASVQEVRTPATCGLLWPESWPNANRRMASLRMSLGTLLSVFMMYAETWNAWGISCRQDSLRRLKSARRTGGSDSSSWPTASAHDGQRPGSDATSTQGRNLKREAEVWQTPSHTTFSMRRQVGQTARTSRGHKDGTNPSTKVPTNSLLGRQAPRSGIGGPQSLPAGPTSPRLFPSPRANKWGPPDSHGKIPEIWQTSRTGDDGTPGEGKGHGGQPKGMRLNPRFVEWLMGFPDAWTDFAPLAMQSYQAWLRSHGVP